MREPKDTDAVSRETLVGRIVNEYMDRRAQGIAESEEDLLSKHPDLARSLKQQLATLQRIQPICSTVDSLIAQGILRKASDSRYAAELGSYKIISLLGRGGMGIVLKAYEESLNRTVAVKILRPELAQDEIVLRRFEREAKAAASIRHPNIISVFAVGQERDVHFLAMEYVDGPTLCDEIRERGALPVEEVRTFFCGILRGLQTAHDAGLIHRDIKPSNVLLQGEDRQVKIADFGLARMIAAQTRLTIGFSALGTPEYMSPEQAQGTEEIDHRSDLYSAGVVLYEMLTGRTPFRSETPAATVHRVIHEIPQSPRIANPDADEALSKLAIHLLSKRPEDRPAGAGQAADMLLGKIEVPRSKSHRRSKGRSLLLAFAAVLIVGFCYWFWPSPRIVQVQVQLDEKGKNTTAILIRYAGEPSTVWHPFVDVPDELVSIEGALMPSLSSSEAQIIVAGTEMASNGDCLFAWDARGEVLWQKNLSSNRHWPDCTPPASFRCTGIAVGDVDEDGDEEIVVAASDRGQYGTRVSIVDTITGDIQSTFWHTGTVQGLSVVNALAANELEPRPLILAWGYNNKLDGFDKPKQPSDLVQHEEDAPVTDTDIAPVLMILDPRKLNGLGPPRTDRIDIPAATPIAYAFLDNPSIEWTETSDDGPPESVRRFDLMIEKVAWDSKKCVDGESHCADVQLGRIGCSTCWATLIVNSDLDFVDVSPNFQERVTAIQKGDVPSYCFDTDHKPSEEDFKGEWVSLIRRGEYVPRVGWKTERTTGDSGNNESASQD